VVAKLLAADSEMPCDSQGMTALHYAVQRGHDKVVTQLLAWVEPDELARLLRIMARFGHTPTQMAAREGHEHIAEMLLLKYPQGVREMDVFGNTLLHSAVQHCSTQFAAKILQMYPGALDARNQNYYCTPFQQAVRADRDDMIDLLQWKMSFFDMEQQCDECDRHSKYYSHARGVPLLRQQCESLTKQLPRDILLIVCQYLDFIVFFGTS